MNTLFTKTITHFIHSTLLFIVVGLLNVAFASQKIRACIPDQNISPFYIVDTDRIGGMTVEHLRLLFRQPALQTQEIDFVLEPWKRCLKDLAQGHIDFIVAGHSEERSKISVFPDDMGFKIKTSAFSSAQICFVKKAESPWTWDGEKLSSDKKLTLGLEPGFLIPQAEKLFSINRYAPIWDVSKKYDLLKLDRVDAVLTVCGVAGQKVIPDKNKIPTGMVTIYPPFIESPVYLAFSKVFYQKYPDVARLIIKTSNQLDNLDIHKAISRVALN